MVSDIPQDKQVFYRLIALWALCEGVLGGIIHGFKLPVSGLIVGSSAVICICLIGRYVPNRGAILKATMVVATFKMMLSPQSPAPAYVAVFFQGLLGELIFLNRKTFKLNCILLAALALVESAGQRIIMMTVIYGMDFWKVINDFANSLVKGTPVDYSLYAILIYLSLHLVAGIFVGMFASRLPASIQRWIAQPGLLISTADATAGDASITLRKKKKAKWRLLLIWLVLIGIYVYSSFINDTTLATTNLILRIFIRSALIILTWYLIVGPIINHLLKSFLTRKSRRLQGDINAVLQLIPSTKYILTRSWQLSSTFTGLKRLRQYCKLVLVNTLHAEH